MKKVVFSALLAVALFGGSFEQVLQGVDSSKLLKAKGFEVKAKEKLYEAARGENLPSLDAKLEAVRLKETPTLYLHIPNLPVMGVPAGTKERYTGEVGISYPLFSGFAITNFIQKSRLEALKAKLEKKDLKRKLYLQAASLYGALYSLSHTIEALQKAKNALEASYKKAKGFYDQGLIPLSDLANIDAKRYETEAKLQETKAKMAQVKEYLRYLAGFAPKEASLPAIVLPQRLDVKKREDILALQQAIAAAQKEVAIAKSSFYPKVGVKAAFRRFGDNLQLDGDGFKNADESYIAGVVEYNLFHGGSDEAKVEAARAKVLAQKAFLSDYIHKAQTELLANLQILKAKKAKLEAAKKGVEAAKSYYELTLGRYKNQLVSADELSRSIASLAEARARLAAARAETFEQQCKVLLLSSLKNFQKVFR